MQNSFPYIAHVPFERLRKYRLDNGLPWFTDRWSVNLFIVRFGNQVGIWSDVIVGATYDTCYRQYMVQCRATSSAWIGEWTNPTHPQGCVYVLDGYYSGGYELGLYKGREALVQVQPFNNVRWPPNKGYVPTVAELNAWAAAGNAFEANCGTNLHNRFDYQAPGRPLTDETEGCPEALYQSEYAALMKMMNVQKEALGSIRASPTFVQASAMGL